MMILCWGRRYDDDSGDDGDKADDDDVYDDNDDHDDLMMMPIW